MGAISKGSLESRLDDPKEWIQSQSKASLVCTGELIVAGFIAFASLGGFFALSVGSVLMSIGGLLLSAMFLVRALQWKQIDALTHKYVVYLENHPGSSVHDLAISMKTDPRTVKEHFAQFAKRGLLVDVVIDEQNGEIIIGSDDRGGYNKNHSDIELVEVECQGCGARKMIPRGSKATCDHCGGELSE